MSIESFNLFLLVMGLVALVVFIALYFVRAGYGMFRSRSWGISVNNKIAWILMEAPVFLVMGWLWWHSDRRFLPVELTFFLFFQLHYFQRAFVFPFLMKGKSKMPVLILLMGVIFNILNGLMQGEWIFYLAPSDYYTPGWLLTPCFWIGTLLFFAGMGINWHSDSVIRHLRAPGDTRHYLPQRGMYRYVTSANYLGEIVEWVGWAILTWSLSGCIFAWWTVAAIHAEGAAASIQIGHCGNMSHKSICGVTPISASSGFNIYSPTWVRGMKREELPEMAKAYGRAVCLAREAGFDAVEVHAGHGYLISQFLSPYTNHRKDEYGGSLENRMRFMTMVMNEVMKAAGKDLAVFVKMNMRDGFRGGMEIEETLEVARRLESLGAHALVLSGGFVSKAPMYVMRGAMPIKTLTHYMDCWWLKFGVKLAGRMMIPTVPFKEAYFLEDALKFRSEIKIPLIYVGGLVSREKIDEVLNEGFEAVQMARALLNEPGFVNRMRREEKARCNCGHSNYCIGRMYTIEMACHQHLTEELPLCLKKEIEQLENK